MRTCHRFLRHLHAVARALTVLLAQIAAATAQIPAPTDAPRPLPPAESLTHFKVPDGFRLELIAAEPVITEPSGVCWDERGRLFVTELHGFNLEGQFDVDELNKTGQLDRVPRRVPASDAAKKAAEAGTYGVVKLLLDRNGDGRYEAAEVWADDLPPCYGACPARGGVIVCCAPEIVFLADRDGDSKVDVRETLFTGIPSGLIDRGVSNPQWGPDGWIYFGRGNGGRTVSGPHLKTPVELPHTDFRIRPDGTAIEPVLGGSHTFGFSFTGLGDRCVPSTRSPAIWIAPLPWNTLSRNPYVAIPGLEIEGADYQQVYPTSQPHPWRTQRASDPGFSKYYTERYGVAESAPNGYFTSACSPLVYQDAAMPALQGQVLTCEPAQNFIHRAKIIREGTRLRLERMPGEEQAEFLTSSDSWFHPIAMTHAPDGSICITDFYREIIEDYSAVPRYLQQIYGVVNGKNHGRLWRLTHRDAPTPPNADLSSFSLQELASEVASPFAWRRETARRLLVERNAVEATPSIAQLARTSKNPFAVFNAFSTLDLLDSLEANDLRNALKHPRPEIRRLALQLAERQLNEPSVLADVLATANDAEPLVRLQLAATLGASNDDQATAVLLRLAREHNDDLWMSPALLSAARDRAGAMLAELLRAPANIGQARSMLEPLATTVGGRRDAQELSSTIAAIAATTDGHLRSACLAGLQSGVAARAGERVQLGADAIALIKSLAGDSARDVREAARQLIQTLQLETEQERQQRLAAAVKTLSDLTSAPAQQLAAVEQLAGDQSAESAQSLLDAFDMMTPQVREAILVALLSRRDRAEMLLGAIEAGSIPPSSLSALQRSTLTTSKDAAIRERAEKLIAASAAISPELLQSYLNALQAARDEQHGLQVFRERCASCHLAHGIGTPVGPDLTAEFQRADDALVRDMLAPSDAIASGYVSYVVLTKSGTTFTGLVAADSPTSITLRQAENKETTILRSEIEEMHASSVSLMPDDLAKQVSPKDFADAIAWLRRPPERIVLLDDDRAVLEEFTDGDGEMEMLPDEAFSGLLSLHVTPLQRSSPHMKHWDFRIRERPAPGEFRYLRFSWKTNGAEGAMLELAANGQWPPAKQALRRYYAGRNISAWEAVEVSATPPQAWTTVTRDLWQESGDFTLTGIAPTALGGPVLFDRIELLRSPE